MYPYLQAALACLLYSAYMLMMSLPAANSLQPKYIAQVKVFIDDSGWRAWRDSKRSGKERSRAQLNADMQALFDDMNTLYKGFDIQLEIKELVVLSYLDVVLPYENYQKDTNTAIFEFQQWITKQYRKDDFDIGLLFTGLNLFSGPSYLTYGVAFKGFVCKAAGIGIVEMFGKIPASNNPSKEARLTAHEIGHILGSKHDQDYPQCSGDRGYLMDASTKVTPSPHIYKFSSCSKNAINGLIDELNGNGTNCMLPGDKGLPAADKACQEREGSPEWYMYRGGYTTYGDNFCVELKCMSRKAATGTAIKTTKSIAPNGLACGKKKQCKGGKCVTVANGDPGIPDECPYGNTNTKVLGYKSSCERLNCERGWKTWCCAYCKTKEMPQ